MIESEWFVVEKDMVSAEEIGIICSAILGLWYHEWIEYFLYIELMKCTGINIKIQNQKLQVINTKELQVINTKRVTSDK